MRRGRLDHTVPAAGEAFHQLAALSGGARVEHIVSSATPDTGEQVQRWDEWVLLLTGSASLTVHGTVVDLGADDWLLLPAGTPHRVLRTAPGTRWLAVHGPAADDLATEARPPDQAEEAFSQERSRVSRSCSDSMPRPGAIADRGQA